MFYYIGRILMGVKVPFIWQLEMTRQNFYENNEVIKFIKNLKFVRIDSYRFS